MIVDFSEGSIPLDSNFDNFFCHVLNLPVADVEEDVVDGGGKESKGKHNNGKNCNSFHDEGCTHQILHDVEGTNESIKHILEVVGDINSVFISTILISELVLLSGLHSLTAIIFSKIIFEFLLVIEIHWKRSRFHKFILQFFEMKRSFLSFLLNAFDV